MLASVLAVVVAFYLAYRWAAHNRARLVGWAEALLAYPPVARLRTRYDAQLRWLLRRPTPGQYLGLHLTAGLLAAAGGLWPFGGLAEDLLAGDPIVRSTGRWTIICTSARHRPSPRSSSSSPPWAP